MLKRDHSWFEWTKKSALLLGLKIMGFLPSATKLRRLCFYTCLSVHREAVPGQVPPQDQVHPQTRYPPGPGTPPMTRYTPHGQVHPPRTRYTPIPRDQVHPPGPSTPHWDQVHPPGPGIPPGTRYTPQGTGTPPRETATVADGTHPTRMHSCYAKLVHNVSNNYLKKVVYNFKNSWRVFQKEKELHIAINVNRLLTLYKQRRVNRRKIY